MHDDEARAFEEAGKRRHPGIAREFVEFLKENRKFWLVPLLVTLLLLALLGVLSGTAAAPFIYTLF